jgi:hypothetical protein
MPAFRSVAGTMTSRVGLVALLTLMNGGWGSQRVATALELAAPSIVGNAGQPTLPKVPFGNKPCQSLTSSDEATLKVSGPLDRRADRAPATLPYDSFCSYTHGGTLVTQVGYQTKLDYDANSSGNRSTTRKAPADLPGAFYDRQGGLWFTKNGYYVVIAGRSAFREPVARIVAGKL